MSNFTIFLFNYRSSFGDFVQKYSKDERFKGVEKMRERESLFNEYIVEVRKREKEEKQQKKEQVRQCPTDLDTGFIVVFPFLFAYFTLIIIVFTHRYCSAK